MDQKAKDEWRQSWEAQVNNIHQQIELEGWSLCHGDKNFSNLLRKKFDKIVQ